ncbi:MAG: hypothetical protein K2X81_03295, partial [Candidatus Obscuribacterales bacterium]|nr:hypothetical protein [Candidatus Obscuribacterales bacterium]
MFQQPYSMPPNQHQFWDAYWKNYWQKYYRQFDDLRPSSQPPYRPDFRREQPRFEPDFQPEYERHEEHEEHEEQEKKERREPRAKNRFEPNGRREQRPENGRTDGPGDRGGRIVSAAKESVGQQLFKFIPGTPGNLGCAASVSAALNKAGFNYAKHAGVFGLTQQLQQNGWSK